MIDIVWNMKRVINRVQRFFTGCGCIDSWNAYPVMSSKVLPILKAYKKLHRHGIPAYLSKEHEDMMVAKGYVYNKDQHSYEGTVDGVEAYAFQSMLWENIVDEIIFAMEYYAHGEQDDDCYVPNPDYNPAQKEWVTDVPRPDGRMEMVFNKDYGKTVLDHDAWTKKMDRVKQGCRYLGEFWDAFWD